MLNLCDLLAGLVLMQGFIPLARRGGVFADNLKRSLITALLASALVSENKDEDVAEQGYLAGSFYTLGYLLLAYYFPRLYEIAAARPTTLEKGIISSINEMVGIDPSLLHLEILEALRIPIMYQDVVMNSYLTFANRTCEPALLNLPMLKSALMRGKNFRLDNSMDTTWDLLNKSMEEYINWKVKKEKNEGLRNQLQLWANAVVRICKANY